MNFLHYLDVIIGYAVAMAVLATLIGAAAATWIALIRTRTRHLRGGLATLVEQLGVKGEQCQQLAQELMMDRLVKARAIWTSLTDPTDWGSVSGQLVRFLRGFAAEPMQREELALILLRKAAEGSEGALTALGLESGAKNRARDLLTKVENAILRQEVENPTLPAYTWRTKALAEHVPQLAAPLFSHFDNLMDRVEDNVRASGKAGSVVFAALFLCFYPVDSFEIINRLSVSGELRQKVVAAAPGMVSGGQDWQVTASLFGDSLERAHWDYERFLTPGVLLTWVMVSLGAPFWLGQITRLLGLRSEIARRMQGERSLRDRDFGSPR
jgi:hypothetical protein